MTQVQGTESMQGSRAMPCRVCMKPMASAEWKWTVHHRGAEYWVCCPSCAQVFNRAPGQFVEEP